MRYVLLAGALIVITGASILIWFYPSSKSPQQDTNPPGTTFPGSGGGTTASSTPSSNSFPLAATSGSSVSSRNFLSDSDVSSPASGYYYLGFHAAADPYQIVYQSTERSFTIELLKEPIGGTRTQAEQYLMTKLGISQSDMCRLDYTLAVPSWVNATYGSRNLLFSFCPGAVSLPQ